ncbi:hypothetical protein IID24_05715, partial [Patescibacteria group bacterium]|nr:hypothetical protein [Patescibacteria group bacterium]
MHSAKCSECGNNCEVPFRPSGEKPVYCSDCFRRRGGESPRGSQDGDRRYSGGRDSETSVSGKPFYKHDSSERTANYKAQFEQLNSKLDRILNALHPAGFVDIKEA